VILIGSFVTSAWRETAFLQKFLPGDVNQSDKCTCLHTPLHACIRMKAGAAGLG
jgi:hypothetical protein